MKKRIENMIIVEVVDLIIMNVLRALVFQQKRYL